MMRCGTTGQLRTGRPMSIDYDSCAAAIRTVIDRLVATQRDSIGAAAALVTDAPAAGGVGEGVRPRAFPGPSVGDAGRGGGVGAPDKLAPPRIPTLWRDPPAH